MRKWGGVKAGKRVYLLSRINTPLLMYVLMPYVYVTPVFLRVKKKDSSMVVLLVALAFFTLLAILGPLVGADSQVSGGWSPIEPGGKLWQNPR